MFTPSNMLQKYLNATPRDMYDIVGALMGYINADPAFMTDDFDQAVQYVLNHGVSKDELFAEFDSDLDFEEDSTKWNEEYYSFARVYLKDNFSEKRIKHVKDVARKLNPDAATIKSTDVQKTVEKLGSNSALTGGSQSTRKKAQGQQHLDRKSERSTMQEHRNVKTKVQILVVVLVLLALIIAAIIFFSKSRTDAKLVAVNGVRYYRSLIIKAAYIAEILELTW